MTDSRSFSAPGPAASMSDRGLCEAVAAELARGKTSPLVLTTVPMSTPDWVNHARWLENLESVVIRRVGSVSYRRALGEVAGDFNPSPSARQKCEAVYLALRRGREEIIG